MCSTGRGTQALRDKVTCPRSFGYQLLEAGGRSPALPSGGGRGPQPRSELKPSPPPPRKKHWSASWTVLEGGVLTFFKDSKTSAAGGLVRPGNCRNVPSILCLWFGKGQVCKSGAQVSKKMCLGRERMTTAGSPQDKQFQPPWGWEQSLRVDNSSRRAGRQGPRTPAHRGWLCSCLFFPFLPGWAGSRRQARQQALWLKSTRISGSQEPLGPFPRAVA